MDELEKRKHLSEVALGKGAPDALITNGNLFEAHTGEFITGQSVWIKNGMIAYVGPDPDPSKDENTLVIDAGGMVLLPGLIDGHTHLSSGKATVDEFVKHVIPGGTTTVITEVIELASIVGKDGLDFLIKGFEGQPIRLYYTLPPLCGLTPTEEALVPSNEELLPFLRDPKCLGIGEIYWSNLFIEGRQGERVRELASMALQLGKRIEGHSAGASGRKLQALASFGISSCHEPITEDEILERLRLGFWVMIRQGTVRKELPQIKPIFKRKIDFRRLILSTDGMDPKGLMEEGYLDASLRTALRLGVPPGLAFQMVTINVAEHFRLDPRLGSLAPGKMADLLLIPSPQEFSPQLVMVSGKIIFRDGKRLVEPKKVFFPDDMLDTVKVPGYSFPPLPRKGKVRAIELVTNLVTKESVIDLEDPGDSRDVIMALALDRLGSGKAFMGFLKGFGLQRGAFGSTLCWDTGDMVVLGCDLLSMATVIERLKETGGGMVYAIGGEIVSEMACRICGVLSLSSMETLADETARLEASLKDNGVKLEKPYWTIDTLTTPAIPHLRITHHGYVRVKDRKVLTWQV